MVDRIKSAVAAKERFAHLDPEFVLIARTDALASEGLGESSRMSCRSVL